jgi:hypothetical protein
MQLSCRSNVFFRTVPYYSRTAVLTTTYKFLLHKLFNERQMRALQGTYDDG